MFKTTVSIATLMAATFVTSTQAEAQFFKSSRGYAATRNPAITTPFPKSDLNPAITCGTTPRRSPQPSTTGISPFGVAPAKTTFRDVRLVGSWVINGSDGTVSRLTFTQGSVVMVKSDDFGDAISNSEFRWKATTASSSDRSFVFKLKHASGTIETYQGTWKSDRSKCKLVTESGEVMILEQASNSSDGF
jgi:hypothetical protein